MSRLSPLLLCVLFASVLLAAVGVAGVSNTAHESSVRTPPASQRTLALLQSRTLLHSHSTFFAQLRARGHNLTFVVAGEESVKLDKYGTPQYENLIVFAPAAEDLGEGASTEAIQRFIDAGRSVLLVADERVSEPIRELAAELGIDIDENGTRVQDHSNFAETEDSQHNLVRGVLTKRGASFVTDSNDKTNKPVLFRGIGHTAQASQLLTPVLTGSGSAYSAAAGALNEYPAAAGADVLLVSAVQTNGHARVVFSGSLDLFSNDLMYRAAGAGEQSGNEAFVREIAAWCFNERGLLRARNLTHYKAGAAHDVNPHSYRVQDHLHFSLVIEEYSGRTHAWQPYVADDVQLEFTMLDPYIRLTLTPSSTGVYSTAFQVPDVYGVYKFVVAHRRPGLSVLDVAAQVSVHPFRHDEFDRFIGQAYPYYAAAFTTMAAFFTFGIVFLYNKE